jgi:hypothetical protein
VADKDFIVKNGLIVGNGNLGVGTTTPAVKTEISGNTSTACIFSSTITGTTMDVTAVTSGTLAVGQYVNSSTGRVRITALGTGTGGVGTYILDTDLTGTFGINRSYVTEPITTRLGNSTTSFDRSIPFGVIEFGGAITNIGPRGYIQTISSINGTSTGSMMFGVGTGNATAPPRTALNLLQTNAQFSGNLSIGVSSLSPRNLTIFPATLFLGGRSQTIFTSGNNLSTLFFASSYIDGGVETPTITYGQLGYRVDSSITSGQLPTNFYIQTRNASGTTAERFTIDKDGSVGIGTTLPLHDPNSGPVIEIKGTATNRIGGLVLRSSDNTVDARFRAWNGQVFIGAESSNDLILRTNGADRITIKSSDGYVGIGTATPFYRLDVSGDVRLGGSVGVLKDPGSFSLDVFGYVNADGLAIGGTAITATAAELNFVDGVTSAIQTQLDAKAPLASPALTGTPTAPTAAVGTNTTQIATTAYVNAEIANDAPTKTGGGASGSWGIDVTGNAATATALASGGADRIKLDGIASGANNYTLPAATSTALGGVELFSDTVQSVAANAVSATASRTYGVQVNSAGQAVVNVPWVDTDTTTDATKLPLAGGTMTGAITFAAGQTWPTFNQNTTGTATTATTANALNTANNYQVNSLGVGTAASGTAGEIRATNNVTAYYSDDRLKTKLGVIDNALEKVLSLSGFYYEANSVAQALGYEVKQEVGVSAQEVQAVMPEVVAPAPIDERYLTVRYERLVPLLIEAIKEQQQQINELKAKLGE